MVYLRLSCLAFLGFLASTVEAQATSTLSSYPTPTYSPTLVQQDLGYNPSEAAAGIFASFYGIATLIIIFRLFSNRDWWGLCLPIGATFMTAGFILRIVMLKYPNSFPIYLCSVLFILLSPTAFLAFNYILYGRFVVSCVGRRYSLIRPERTAMYFIISDITTFMIQATGASLLTSTDPNTDKTGSYIVIGGLALQTLSYLIYMLLVYHAFRSLRRAGIKPFEEPWGMIFKLLCFTSVFLLLRCIYRTIEFAQLLGNGYLINHEVFFYVFDSLPVLIGISVYAVFWPGLYLCPVVNVSPGEMSDFVPADTPNIA